MGNQLRNKVILFINVRLFIYLIFFIQLSSSTNQDDEESDGNDSDAETVANQLRNKVKILVNNPISKRSISLFIVIFFYWPRR